MNTQKLNSMGEDKVLFACKSHMLSIKALRKNIASGKDVAKSTKLMAMHIKLNGQCAETAFTIVN